MSKAGTTLFTMARAKVDAERKAMIAKERKRIDAEDKIKFAQDDREAVAGRETVKQIVAENHERDARREAERAERAELKARLSVVDGAEPKAKRVKGERKAKSNAHADYTFGRKIEDDNEFTAEMAKHLRKDKTLTWAGVLVEMRKAGIAGGTKRAARLFSAAQAQAIGSKVGKTAKGSNDGPVALKRLLDLGGKTKVKATAPKRSKKISKRK